MSPAADRPIYTFPLIQKNAQNCGNCDVCIKKNELGLTYYDFEQIKQSITEKLTESPQKIEVLVEFLNFADEKVIKVIRWLLDNDYLYYQNEQILALKKISENN